MVRYGLGQVVEHWGADLYPVFRRLCRDALALPGKNLPAALQEVTGICVDLKNNIFTGFDKNDVPNAITSTLETV